MMNQAIATATDTPPLKHMFEQEGLGLAPYTFLGVEPIPGAHCQFCNTPIVYLFWLRSADNKVFYVGSDCILESGDAGLKVIIDPIIKEHRAKMARQRHDALIDAFKTFLVAHPTFFADDVRPHVSMYRSANSQTIGGINERRWSQTRWLGRAQTASLAREFLLLAGEILPAIARPRSKKACEHAFLVRLNGHCKKCGILRPVPVVTIVQGMFGGVKIIDMGD
jgi:hypothetical protein